MVISATNVGKGNGMTGVILAAACDPIKSAPGRGWRGGSGGFRGAAIPAPPATMAGGNSLHGKKRAVVRESAE